MTDAQRAYAKAYREKHRDRLNANVRARYARSGGLRLSQRSWTLKNQYGITHEDYERMLAEQGGCCRLCRSDKPRGRGRYFSVDHNHDTGVVRGLLCLPCNTRVGIVEGWYRTNRDKVDAYIGGGGN